MLQSSVRSPRMKKRAEHRVPSFAQRLSIAASAAFLATAFAWVLVAVLRGSHSSEETEALADVDIESMLNSTALKGGYEPATLEHELRAIDLFERLLTDGSSAALLKEMNGLGFIVEERTAADGQSRIFVREHPEHAEGKGFYVISEQGKPILLQAPHRYKDVGTGAIVARLMQENAFRAAAWNTVPRWYEEKSGRVDADLAHIEVSHFNAFGIAFARVFPEGRVVQIHGFSRDHRTTASGRSASIIVSSGTRRPETAARKIAGCLASGLPTETVLLYPTQVSELGATTNANAHALRAAGFDNFLHIEVSRELRETLLIDPQLRALLAESIAKC